MQPVSSILSSDLIRAVVADAAARGNFQALFHAVEHAILRAYFGMSPPKYAPQDLLQAGDFDGDPQDRPYVGVDHRLHELALPNAVARLCLGAFQQRLRPWGVVRADGTVDVAHKAFAKRACPVAYDPVHLLQVDWVDSTPGCSYPVAYHATRIPGYERWAVTASTDSDDAWGCRARAIGWFTAVDVLTGAGRVIRKEWRAERREAERGPWNRLLEEGVVGEADASAWRARVWRGHERL